MKNIVFVGDSYCSAWAGPSVIPHWPRQQKFILGNSGRRSWLDVSAAKLGLDLYSFGFSGASWYYSRLQLFKHMDLDPDWIKNVAVMVFCHTDCWRYNTSNGDVGVEMAMPDYQPADKNEFYEGKVRAAKAYKSWLLDLMDVDYQFWVQEQWFHEIARTFQHVPQMHFCAFPHNVDIAKKILPGIVFTTPLVHVSLGEATGTDAEIVEKFMVNDQRCNHFSMQNNQALGDLVADSMQNYQPGARSIDTDKFDIINPNAVNWPNPGFGTVF
jgi:hypothetical protein